jgi:hypothetical protein
MLSSWVSVEEISHALLHGSIEHAKEYLQKFPSKYSNDTIKRFKYGIEI